MGAPDRDGKLEPHQFGQHFGPAHQRQAGFAARDHLGIVLLDRGRIDHRRSAFHMGPVVADKDLRAQPRQPLGIGAGLGVRALHRIADADHDLGDPAHADAADADEMHGADVEGNGADGHGLRGI